MSMSPQRIAMGAGREITASRNQNRSGAGASRQRHRWPPSRSRRRFHALRLMLHATSTQAWPQFDRLGCRLGKISNFRLGPGITYNCFTARQKESRSPRVLCMNMVGNLWEKWVGCKSMVTESHGMCINMPLRKARPTPCRLDAWDCWCFTQLSWRPNLHVQIDDKMQAGEPI
ncbi:hypothetical protein J3F84DRAFT_236695 [Trichoderma pleuroticola]